MVPASGRAAKRGRVPVDLSEGPLRERFRTRQSCWLDARFDPIGTFLNARLKLLEAGRRCGHKYAHRLVRAIWWIQVVLPRCDCYPDRVLDLLVVRRDGRYRSSVWREDAFQRGLV